MLFNSTEFLLFFSLVTSLFFLLPHKFRWALLLVASCYFYMAFVPYYILILGFTIVVDYYAGILIEKARNKRRKKRWLICSLVANIGVLAIFKYYNFFNDNLSAALQCLGFNNQIPFLEIILPIGLSFHTFQAMSYTIEVYRGNFKAEKNFGVYSLYVMFYPQLVAGPIERPQNILPQFYKVQYFDYSRIVAGLKLMLWGMFKKVVIADRLSVYVNAAYANPDVTDGYSLLLTTYFFAFQVYCDFSGYSDIALGTAKVMGYDLMENFRVPYIAQSIKEFWSRWHISLSTWFRDYLYIPLGGNRVAKWRWYFNLIIVFLISGLWHGANWTYVIWGALHGIYLVAEVILEGKFKNYSLTSAKRIIKWSKILFTFHLALLAWIFFRAKSLTDAVTIIKRISLELSLFSFTKLHAAIIALGGSKIIFTILLLILFICIDPYMDKLVKGRVYVKERSVRWLVYASLTAALMLFGYFGEVHFIYFQF